MSAVLETAAVARAKDLNPQRLGLAENTRQMFTVDAEEGTTVEDVLKPAYWAHVSSKFQPWDRIEVRLETGEWLLELLVISSERSSAYVHLLKKHDLPGSEAVKLVASDHRIEWKGSHLKHCVIRIFDGAMVQSGLQSKDAAHTWLRNHEQVTAA